MKRYIALIIGIILIGSFIHYFPTEEGTQLTEIYDEIYYGGTYHRNLIGKITYQDGCNIFLNYIKKEISEGEYETLPSSDGYLVWKHLHDSRYCPDWNKVKNSTKYFLPIIPITDILSFYNNSGDQYGYAQGNYFSIHPKKPIAFNPIYYTRTDFVLRVTYTNGVSKTYTNEEFLDTSNFESIFFTKIKESYSKVNSIVLELSLYKAKIKEPDKWIYINTKEFPFILKTKQKEIPDEIILILEHITPTSITFRSNIENYLQNYTVEIYDKNSFTKLNKPITQDTTYTFTISELTPNTEYRIVYGDKEMFVTTLEEPETLDLIPLGTEKTSNSFVQVYKVIGKDVNHNIQLKHENNVWNYDPQFDGENYYVVFDELVTGDYDYTIIVSNTAGEKRYSNSFYIKNTEEDLGISLDVDPAKIGEDSFYLRFRVTGEGYYDTYFEYMNEQTFKVEEVDINHGIRYDDVTIENLTEGDYSYKLILSTEKGNIEHEGSFTIKKEVQPTYIPPYSPPSENKNFLPYLAVIIIILVIGYILIKPKTIKTKKRRK